MLAILGCLVPPARQPMRHLVLSETGTQTLLLFPGRFDRDRDFAKHGIGITRPQDQLRVIAADAHLGYYRDRSLVTRVDADILTPLMPGGGLYGGISLGGLGAVILARDAPDRCRGLVLFAPFLGSDALVQRVALQGTQTRPDDDQRSRDILSLWRVLETRTDLPIWIGCGRDDNLAHAVHTLKKLRPDAHLEWVEGSHDWSTWTRLWQRYLETRTDARRQPR